MIQDGRMLQTDAAAGFVVGVPPQTQAVGSFMYSTVLDFAVLKENTVSNISVRLNPQMLISSGEKVELHLPGFEFVHSFKVSTDLSKWNTTANASWSSDNSTLTWTLHDSIGPNSNIVLHIPDAAMLKLPFRGMLNGTANLSVSTKAAFGQVAFEEIFHHPSPLS